MGLSGFTMVLQTPSNAAVAVQEAAPADGDFTTVGGLQSKTMDFAASEIDITADDTNENRTLLDGHGIKSLDFSADGFLKNNQIYKDLEASWASQSLRWFRIIQPDNGNRTYTAKFKITSIQHTGTHDGAVGFSATLMSSGAVTIA